MTKDTEWYNEQSRKLEAVRHEIKKHTGLIKAGDYLRNLMDKWRISLRQQIVDNPFHVIPGGVTPINLPRINFHEAHLANNHPHFIPSNTGIAEWPKNDFWNSVIGPRKVMTVDYSLTKTHAYWDTMLRQRESGGERTAFYITDHRYLTNEFFWDKFYQIK